MRRKKFFHKNFENLDVFPPSTRGKFEEFVAFRLSENMLQQLKQRALQEDTDLSNFIRDTLKKELINYGNLVR
jgi:predicted DNA binding CopG/RHH family protein